MQVDLVVVGAGAAGLGAAKAADRLGLSYLVLEASHRIGGRAYTETLTPDVHFDLGCHWLHTASRNPFTQLLDQYGMETEQKVWQPQFYRVGEWCGLDAGFEQFESETLGSMNEQARKARDSAAIDGYPRDHEWTAFLDYWISLLTSADPDQVSMRDLTDFVDTGKGEDWPVREGYGTLIKRFGANVPVRLDARVRGIDWGGDQVVVKTGRGDVTASKVIITVSTGVLNAGDILFEPRLPQWKQEATQNLPLGNHNRICMVYDRNVFGDFDFSTAICLDGDHPPMFFEIRPFGLNYAVASTGGRFADWLEKAGQAASVDCARENLVRMFGSGSGKNIVRTVVTAWRGDPLVRGAYSALAPGAHGARRDLAEPVDDLLFFAGEATSAGFHATAHGAYMSGVREALRVAAALNGKPSREDSFGELSWLLTRRSDQRPTA